jgi:glycerol-3-phosphate dehydrogenase
VADDRDITRAHTVIDHSQVDGVGRFVTIVGGKFATYRLMAEETMDAVCRTRPTSRCPTRSRPATTGSATVCACARPSCTTIS